MPSLELDGGEGDPLFAGVALEAGRSYFISATMSFGRALWFGSNSEAARTIAGTGDISVGPTFGITDIAKLTFNTANARTLLDPRTLNFRIGGTRAPTIARPASREQVAFGHCLEPWVHCAPQRLALAA